MDSLKPCPFCGEKELLRLEFFPTMSSGGPITECYIECDNCGACGQTGYLGGPNVPHDEALKMAYYNWNDRVEDKD